MERITVARSQPGGAVGHAFGTPCHHRRFGLSRLCFFWRVIMLFFMLEITCHYAFFYACFYAFMLKLCFYAFMLKARHYAFFYAKLCNYAKLRNLVVPVLLDLHPST